MWTEAMPLVSEIVQILWTDATTIDTLLIWAYGIVLLSGHRMPMLLQTTPWIAPPGFLGVMGPPHAKTGFEETCSPMVVTEWCHHE